MKQPKPTKHSSVVLNQLCKLIPVGRIRALAIEYGVDKKSRTFSPWSHVAYLLYCQLTHCIGLNDLCDSLRHHSAKLFTVRGATPPSRNGLSHVNKSRNADMMEALFWKMLDHLQNQFPGFGPSGRYSGLPRRFKHLFALTGRGVFWVTRPKDNMRYHVCKKRKVSGGVLRDDEVTLKTKNSKADYPQRMRRIVARVKVDGKETEMIFITNNME